MSKSKKEKVESVKNATDSMIRNRKVLLQEMEADDEYKGWIEQLSEELLDSDD